MSENLENIQPEGRNKGLEGQDPEEIGHRPGPLVKQGHTDGFHEIKR